MVVGVPWVDGVEVFGPETSLSPLQGEAFGHAVEIWDVFEDDGRAAAVLVRDESGLWRPPGVRSVGLVCGELVSGRRVGERCLKAAGDKTAHVGVGPCRTHYGRGEWWSRPVVRAGNGRRVVPRSRQFERALWSWVMAHAYAQARDVSPWDALLGEVRDLAGQVAWLNDRLLDAEKVGGVDALRPGGPGWDWVQMRDARGQRLAQVSKMAIDAGVASYLLEQVRAQGELMFRAAQLAAQELGLPQVEQLRLVTLVAQKLTELEGQSEGLEGVG